MDLNDLRRAVEARDHAALEATLAPDVVFHSPVTFRPFEGREQVGAVLRAVLEVFEDFRYVDELRSAETLALRFEARVGDREIEGIDLLRAGADGRVAELTVMVRPLTATIALAEAVSERLGARPPALGHDPV